MTTTFLDVPTSHVFHPQISWTASAGLLNGWNDGTFRPYQPIERGAMAAVFYRLSGKPYYEPPATSMFVDVRPGADFYKEIHWVKQRGLLNGWGDGTFKPRASITREATAALLYRSAGSPAYTAPATSRFKDVKISNPFYQEIHWMAENKITNGWSDGTFRPLTSITRDAMAAFLERFDRAV